MTRGGCHLHQHLRLDLRLDDGGGGARVRDKPAAPRDVSERVPVSRAQASRARRREAGCLERLAAPELEAEG